MQGTFQPFLGSKGCAHEAGLPHGAAPTAQAHHQRNIVSALFASSKQVHVRHLVHFFIQALQQTCWPHGPRMHPQGHISSVWVPKG